MNQSLLLFEDDGYKKLLPLVWWRSVFELLVGRKIMLDRTAQRLGLPVAGVWTRDWLAAVASQRCGAPANQRAQDGTILANGRWLVSERPSFAQCPCVGELSGEVAYVVCDEALASRLSAADLLDPAKRKIALDGVPRELARGRMLHYPWDIVGNLAALLADDWTSGDAAIDSELDPKLVVDQPDRLHVGESTRIHPSVQLDTCNGPIFISHDVEIGAFCVIDGPTYIGPGCRIRPHAWLHGANAIGPVSRVGGEIDGCVMHSYSNKQHSGFLGHAYVGSWVNVGAGATNSDLKNTYGSVRVPVLGESVDTGQQFFGATIGDHAKIGINAALPTGASIGMGVSIASTQLLPKYLPSFSWVTDSGIREGDSMRILDIASAVMARRNVDMTDEEVELFVDLGARVRDVEPRT